jgi:hypothetical protein
MGSIGLKGLGYLVSTISVLFLGTVAWPKPGEPQWIAIAVVIGMATSIGGMFLRYLAHLKTEREIRETEQEARRP